MAVETETNDTTSAQNDDVIVLEHLTKVFDGRGGQVRAVDDLNLRVRRGEIFGLLGPNGAGKTTTVGMLTTRVIPTSGRASVGGIDVVAHPAAAKQVIGVVPQTNTLDRSLDVAGEPLLPRPLLRHERARRRTRAPTSCSSSSGSPTGPSANVAELSGGMAQRLMVARAIMHDPDVLFLDEPTSGLDPQSRLALWDVIGELHATGRRSCSPRTTWKKPTNSASASRSSTTASCSRSTRPTASRGRSAPTPRSASTRPATSTRSRRRSSRCRASTARASSTTRCTSYVQARRPDAARDHHARRPAASQVQRRRREGDDARDRVHQPHRKGAPRMTAVADPTVRRAADPSASQRVRCAACSATSRCCARKCGCSSAAR